MQFLAAAGKPRAKTAARRSILPERDDVVASKRRQTRDASLPTAADASDIRHALADYITRTHVHRAKVSKCGTS